MPTRRNTSRFRRSAFGATCLILLAWSLLDGAARAAGHSGAELWQSSVKISAATHIESLRGRSASFSTIGAHIDLERSSSGSPVSAGLFADIEFTSQNSGDRFTVAGGWASYSRERWHISTSVAYFQANHSSGNWIHANTIQFEPRRGHKLAIAAIGAFGNSRTPATQLIYKTKLGGVAVALNFGIGGTRPQDVGASTKFIWSIY
jgi:hypothetical protein